MTAAERDSAAVKARLERIYGRVPAVVYLAQLEPDGPVRIGRALRIGAAIRALHRESETVEFLAVIPGGQPLQHWFRKRYVHPFDTPMVQRVDARAVGDTHATAYGALSEPDPIKCAQMAGVIAVRAHDPFLADLERLYRAGTMTATIAELSGLSEGQLRSVLNSMRALGFDVPHRRGYGSRREPSVRVEGPTLPAGRRLLA